MNTLLYFVIIIETGFGNYNGGLEMKKIREGMIAILLLLTLVLSACGNGLEANVGEENSEIMEESVVIDPAEYLMANDDWPSIAEVYKDYFPIGVAIEPNSTEDETEVAVLTKHFNSITCENMMKPGFTQATEGNFTFENAQPIVDFALDNDMRIVGHNLVWYMQTEPWYFQDAEGNPLDPENEEDCALVEARMKEHITTVVRYYEDAGHVIERWDVVNEAILETEEDGFRKCEWYSFLGKDYVSKAFAFAYEADMMDGTKDIRLFYNDYQNTNLDKQDLIVELLEELIANEVPIDGVGIQAHLGLASPSVEEVGNCIDRYAALGLDVEITELDINIYDQVLTPEFDLSPELNVTMGYRYKELMECFVARADKITGVTLWGYYDGHTWLSMPEYAYMTPAYPLPFDTEFNPKWAYWGMVDPSVMPDASEGLLVLEFENPQSTATYTEEAPLIDAEKDACYELCEEFTTFNQIVMPFDGTDPAEATFYVCWKDNNLYIYTEVVDADLNHENAEPHQKDSIEIFLDENNSKSMMYEDTGDGQYRVSYTGAFSFNGKDTATDIEYETRTTDNGYVIEWRIAPQSITLEEGLVIGFDVQVNDANEFGSRDGITTWAGVKNNNWNSTTEFGDLTLVK